MQTPTSFPGYCLLEKEELSGEEVDKAIAVIESPPAPPKGPDGGAEMMVAIPREGERTALEYPGWERLQHANVVFGVRSGNQLVWELPQIGQRGSALALVPFLWSGVASIGKKGGNWFFKRIVKLFVGFVEIFKKVVLGTWLELQKALLGQGFPDSMEKGHRNHSDIEIKNAEVERKGYKGRTPWSGSNLNEGVGLWEYTRSGRVNRLTIREVDGPDMNSKGDTHGRHWRLEPDTTHLILKWRDGKDAYGDNDGECYGSFTLWHKRN